MTIDLMRTVADQLQVGQPLPFGVRDENGQLLLARGRVIASDAQLQILLTRGLYADHDAPEAGDDAAQAGTAGRPRTLFDLWKQTTARLDLLLNSLHQAGFAERCHGFAGQLAALIDRDPDIGIYHSVRQDPHRLSLYGLSHALHCAMVCQLAARRAGWAPERVLTLMKAALTMNLSIVEVQGRFATLGRLNDTQRDQIRGHPQAAAIIKEYGIYPPGNFVQLASGEMAVVIRRGATAHTPVAAAVTDKNGIPVVRTAKRNTAEPAYAIKNLVPDSKMMLRLPPERLYGLVQ